MICKKCGKKIDDDSTFCPFCGEKVSNTISTKITRKVVRNESLRCPHCDAPISSFDAICPYCGSTLSSVNHGTNRIDELCEALQATNDINKKSELIANFYVPNTKEDIKEFFALAVSQIGCNNGCENAWYVKLKQVLIKAKIFFDDKIFYEQLNKQYEEVKLEVEKEVERSKRERFVKNNFGLIVSFLLMAVGIALIILYYMWDVDWMSAGGVLLLITGVIPFSIIRNRKKKQEENQK